MTYQAVQTRRFARQYKKLHDNIAVCNKRASPILRISRLLIELLVKLRHRHRCIDFFRQSIACGKYANDFSIN